MANGFSGSDEQWRILDAALATMDDFLKAFAAAQDLKFTVNPRNSLGRLLESMGQPRRILQLYLDSEEAETFTFWGCAYEDRGSKRFMKQRTFLERATLTELLREVPAILETSWDDVSRWESAELTFATRLG